MSISWINVNTSPRMPFYESQDVWAQLLRAANYTISWYTILGSPTQTINHSLMGFYPPDGTDLNGEYIKEQVSDLLETISDRLKSIASGGGYWHELCDSDGSSYTGQEMDDNSKNPYNPNDWGWYLQRIRDVIEDYIYRKESFSNTPQHRVERKITASPVQETISSGFTTKKAETLLFTPYWVPVRTGTLELDMDIISELPASWSLLSASPSSGAAARIAAIGTVDDQVLYGGLVRISDMTYNKSLRYDRKRVTVGAAPSGILRVITSKPTFTVEINVTETQNNDHTDYLSGNGDVFDEPNTPALPGNLEFEYYKDGNLEGTYGDGDTLSTSYTPTDNEMLGGFSAEILPVYSNPGNYEIPTSDCLISEGPAVDGWVQAGDKCPVCLGPGDNGALEMEVVATAGNITTTGIFSGYVVKQRTPQD